MKIIIRGQSAIEFVIIVSSVLFVFTAMVISVQYQISDKNKEKINLAVMEIALTVQDEINIASSTIDGYEREFEIPEKIVNKEYEVNITDGTVYVRTNDGRFGLSLPVLEVTGDVVKRTNKI